MDRIESIGYAAAYACWTSLNVDLTHQGLSSDPISKEIQKGLESFTQSYSEQHERYYGQASSKLFSIKDFLRLIEKFVSQYLHFDWNSQSVGRSE